MGYAIFMKLKFIQFISILLLILLPLSSTFANSKEVGVNQLIIINKSTNELAFYDSGELVSTFSVGTGKTDTLTPEGHFKIVNRLKNVPYYKHNIPGGDPRNPLGDRWLGLNARGTSGMTYGIHGNNNSNSIGQYVSAGCIRMHNDEVRWLFDRVKVGAEVVILKSSNSFSEIAAKYGIVDEKIVPIYINEELIDFEENAVLDRNKRVIAPMRRIFESLGANVEWDPIARQVLATKDQTSLVLTIDSAKVIVNGVETVSDTPVSIRNGHTFIPLRLVSEVLQAHVEWRPSDGTVYITLPQIENNIIEDEIYEVVEPAQEDKEQVNQIEE